MSWERRWRDMLVAGGGVLAAAGCSSKDDAREAGHPSPHQQEDEPQPEPTPDAAPDEFEVTTSCCNANPDPCCRVLYCGSTMTPACACRQEGGTIQTNFDTPDTCIFPGDAALDGREDAADGKVDGPDAARDAATDAAPDADASPPPFFCCNANPDPCCPVMHCGHAMTDACSCEQSGGRWDDSSSGAGACVGVDGGRE